MSAGLAAAAPAESGRPRGEWQALAVAALALLAWELTPWDLWLAHLAGGADGFPWRTDWWLETLMHRGARAAGWLLALALVAGAWRPNGALRRLDRPRRWQLALTPVLAALLISLLKQRSGASCPWDLAAFGGEARLMGHWSAFLLGDGGPGHCFPAGHAVTGFGFVGGWFAWRDVDRAVARRWLAGALAAGLALGLVQQWRGAHYMSHTLWTAWCCFAVAVLLDDARRRLARRLGAGTAR